MNYKQILKDLESVDDRNNCTVISASVAFEMDYHKVSDFFFLHGRRRYHGLKPTKTDKMIRLMALEFGYKATVYKPSREPIPVSYNGITHYKKSKTRQWIQVGTKQHNDPNNILCSTYGNMTANNCTDYLPKGNYILGVRGHVLGVQGGVVQDWTKGRKHYINRIWNIEKTGKIVKPLTFADEMKTRKLFL